MNAKEINSLTPPPPPATFLSKRSTIKAVIQDVGDLGWNQYPPNTKLSREWIWGKKSEGTMMFLGKRELPPPPVLWI